MSSMFQCRPTQERMLSAFRTVSWQTSLRAESGQLALNSKLTSSIHATTKRHMREGRNNSVKVHKKRNGQCTKAMIADEDLEMAEVVAAKIAQAKKIAKQKAKHALFSDLEATTKYVVQLEEEQENLRSVNERPYAHPKETVIKHAADMSLDFGDEVEEANARQLIEEVESLADEAVEVWSHTVEEIQQLEPPDPWTEEVIKMLMEKSDEVVVMVPEVSSGTPGGGRLIQGYFQRSKSALKGSAAQEISVVGAFNNWRSDSFNIPLLSCLAAPSQPDDEEEEDENDWAEDFSFMTSAASPPDLSHLQIQETGGVSGGPHKQRGSQKSTTTSVNEKDHYAEDFSFMSQEIDDVDEDEEDEDESLTENFSWQYFLLEAPADAYEMNFVFTDGRGNYDNNNKKDFIVKFQPQLEESRNASTKVSAEGHKRSRVSRQHSMSGEVWWVEPEEVKAGSQMTLYFHQNSRHLRMANLILLQMGINGWSHILHAGVEMHPSGKKGEGLWEIPISVPSDATELNFVFEDGMGNFDNNQGKDYRCIVTNTKIASNRE